VRWCFDTSALVEPWVRHYPPDLFPRVWEALEQLARDGAIRAPVDVRHEFERQSDALCEWARSLHGFFEEADRRAMEIYTDVVNRHVGFLKVNSTKSGADPVVVAVAAARGVPVVTYETMAKQDAAPKIPNVCDSLGIRCVSLVDVLRSEGLRL
jgi:hypothetical protein